MIGHKPNLLWQVLWRVISPLIMFLILVFYFITKVSEKLLYKTWNPTSVNMNMSLNDPRASNVPTKIKNTAVSFQKNFPAPEEKPYPTWIYAIIFILAGIPSIAIPFTAAWKFIKFKYTSKSHSYEITDQIKVSDPQPNVLR